MEQHERIQLETEEKSSRGYLNVCKSEPSSLGQFLILLSYVYPTTLCVNNLYLNILLNVTADCKLLIVNKPELNVHRYLCDI